MANKPPHIVIVDDNPENIRVLGAVFPPNKYQITIATNGETALKTVEQNPPDLILLDLMMPGIDGFEVCRRLKSNPKTQDIEIIFVTAATAENNELKGIALGAIDYIYKPFSVPLILTKVEKHLERLTHKKDLRLKNAALEEVVKLRDDIERITRHDLKTPLNAILGFPQLMLMDDNLNSEQRGYLEEILRAGNEMNNMINNSLDLFKMETGCYPYQPNWVDISMLINTILRDLKSYIEQHGVKITVSQQPQPERQKGQTDNFIVMAEKSLSYSLFANLIRNAIEACPSHDTISIAMSYDGNDGIIAITNPGTVPEEIRESFFEKYATAGKAQGTGLGTYSARLMATTQNGTINMTTNNKETSIVVRLPYKNSQQTPA